MAVKEAHRYSSEQPAAVLLQGVCFTYPDSSKPVFSDLSLQVPDGEFAAVIGPNGVGKSTLLRLITGFMRPQRGRVLLGETPVGQLSHQQRARRLAVVRQTRNDRFGFTVGQLVAMGRTPHKGRLGRPSSRDRQKVARALTLCNLRHLADRPITSLSGGERQRAAVAKALAQEPDILLLDEPTAHLDIHYQLEILDLVTRENRRRSTTVLVVLHDLNLASRYCSRLYLLGSTGLHHSGPPEEVLNRDNIAEVYGTDRLRVIEHPRTQRPVLIPDE